jgi:putative hydrolase of the HAD superfamily
MIRGVLFDLDGTLLDREVCIRNCIENQFERFASQLAPIPKADFLALFTRLDQRGYVAKPIVYDRMRLELGFSASLSKALTDDYFLTYPRFRIGFRNMAKILAWLRQQALRLAIVTNGSTSHQSSAIQALGIDHLFDAIVISETEGVRKPDRRIFDLTLKRLGIAPAEAVFVGDHPETDIRGAQEAGIRAIWKRATIGDFVLSLMLSSAS